MAVNQAWQQQVTIAEAIRQMQAQQQRAAQEAAIFAHAMRDDAPVDLVLHDGVWMLPEDVRRSR